MTQHSEIVCSSLKNIKVFKMASLDIVFKNAKPRYVFFKSCAYLVNGPSLLFHFVKWNTNIYINNATFLHVISECGAPGQKLYVLLCIIYMYSSATSYLAFVLFAS